MPEAEHVDIAVVGAGAAGLMAAIWAARTGPALRVVAFDGAKSLGAKILVAGGGRCNVTHHRVDETAFAGSSRSAIRKVLLRFDVPRTVGFFRELGVQLKREDTGKLFPTTDRARTVLDALLAAVRAAGARVVYPVRIDRVERGADAFTLLDPRGGAVAHARRVILAAGGRALPKSGSDGHGYEIARSLGHTTTERIFPALVPLTLPKGHPLCALSGVATRVTLEVRSSGGKRIAAFTNSMLCAHFGISGPCALDISRYYTDARRDDPGAQLVCNWIPGVSPEALGDRLQQLGGRGVITLLREHLPDRLARSLCEQAGVDPTTTGAELTRAQRRAVAAAVCAMELPVTGDRGYTHAEVTAGGVPLREVRLETMESRICPGLHLCGEILDVDGRIGGFNFQWAWASGFVAGRGAATGAASGIVSG